MEPLAARWGCFRPYTACGGLPPRFAGEEPAWRPATGGGAWLRRLLRGVGQSGTLVLKPPHFFQHLSSVSALRADPPSPSRGEGSARLIAPVAFLARPISFVVDGQ